MGGNALKNCETHRLPKAEYDAIVDRCCNTIATKLRMNYGNRTVMPTASYSSKEDFGDADLLMVSDNLPENWVEILAAEWKSKETFSNGDCVSFEVDGFQVDVIKTPDSGFTMAYTYFAYNDLGNLLGKLSRKLGVRFGHTGLFYNMKDDHATRIFLTDDPDAIFDFLALDMNVYLDGFKTREDIFEFVASSPFFNPSVYLFDNLNHQSRRRDSKRVTYNLFLEWCEKNKDRFVDSFEFHENSDDYLPSLFDYFSNDDDEHESFRDKWFKVRHDAFDKKTYKEKFNGTLVKELTGFDGKMLGKFMEYLVPSMTQDLIIVLTPERIADLIKTHSKLWVYQP